MQTLDTEQLVEIRSRQSDVPVINVLPREAYEKKHISGSVSIPGDAADFPAQVERVVGGRALPVVVYCAGEDCDASAKAAGKLENAGFTHVFDYEGGTAAWAKAGLSVEGSEVESLTHK